MKKDNKTNQPFKIVLFIIFVLCIWAISTIQLHLFPSINVKWSQELCDNVNNVYINLSYSFMAGFIFYLLTVSFPHIMEKKRIKPVLQQKVHNIKNEFRRVLIEFSRDTRFGDSFFEENARKVLMSKIWTNNVPMYKALYNIDISYVAFIGEVGRNIKIQITNLIQSYQLYLSTEQICLLEELYSMQIFSTAIQFGKMPISLEDENGKKSLVDFFIEALNKMDDVERSFN